MVPGSPAVLRALVAFLYTGVAPLGGCRRADLATLLAAAEEYALPGLAAPVRLKLHPVPGALLAGSRGAAPAVTNAGFAAKLLAFCPTLSFFILQCNCGFFLLFKNWCVFVIFSFLPNSFSPVLVSRFVLGIVAQAYVG